MAEPAVWDTHNCPRCERYGLRFVGYFPEGKSRGSVGGAFYSCLGCNGWFSTIELRRLDGSRGVFHA